MKRYLLSIVLAFTMSFKINAHVDHYTKYNYLEYELFRNNKSIGYHKYDFKREGKNLIIYNEISFKIFAHKNVYSISILKILSLS